MVPFMPIGPSREFIVLYLVTFSADQAFYFVTHFQGLHLNEAFASALAERSFTAIRE
jgi:hypothetical protein